MKEIQAEPDAWRERRVLYLHTGGLLGMYDKIDQLQPLLEKANPVERMHVPE
jgi:D-cysteine desulfhydrase